MKKLFAIVLLAFAWQSASADIFYGTDIDYQGQPPPKKPRWQLQCYEIHTPDMDPPFAIIWIECWKYTSAWPPSPPNPYVNTGISGQGITQPRYRELPNSIDTWAGYQPCQIQGCEKWFARVMADANGNGVYGTGDIQYGASLAEHYSPGLPCSPVY